MANRRKGKKRRAPGIREPAGGRRRTLAVAQAACASGWLWGGGNYQSVASSPVDIMASRPSVLSAGDQMASLPVSPVRIRMASPTGSTKILPSPIFPEEALAWTPESAGEVDFPEIWPDPAPVVVQCLRTCHGWMQVNDNLPDIEIRSLRFERFG